ncbi:MAG: hypothetical protein PHD48_01580 [Alphaproteobacteria bacterium]|nr:hypothetical protein [Alphaproteobacteria bacterium]
MTMTEKEIKEAIDTAIVNYKGQSPELEQAIGALMLARHIGWKPLFLMHDRRTIVKYEKILKVSFREAVREEGELAFKSIAWGAFQGCTNFWKAVTGAISGIRDNGLKKI